MKLILIDLNCLDGFGQEYQKVRIFLYIYKWNEKRLKLIVSVYFSLALNHLYKLEILKNARFFTLAGLFFNSNL